MKIVVIGGTGRIGSQVIKNLRERAQDVVAADLNTGVNTITGEGLDSALADAQVVVDLSNSPSFEDAAVFEFFQTSGRNLLKAEVNASVGHHVALSIVGADRLPDSGYLRAKVAQEQLIEGAGQPYTIIRSTQFFEFLRAIADSATNGHTVTVPTANLQPIAAQNVAAAVAEVAMSDPVNGVIEIPGTRRAPGPSDSRSTAGKAPTKGPGISSLCAALRRGKQDQAVTAGPEGGHPERNHDECSTEHRPRPRRVGRRL